MVNEIIKGISIALNAAFGDEYEIYADDVKQGLNDGSFFINSLEFEVSPLLGGRALRINPFDILYFPKTENVHMECYSVAESMLDPLRLITLPNGDRLLGTGMRYELQDDVLHFFVNYNHTRRVTTEESAMESLDLETGTV